jgi:hypothetical protein
VRAVEQKWDLILVELEITYKTFKNGRIQEVKDNFVKGNVTSLFVAKDTEINAV